MPRPWKIRNQNRSNDARMFVRGAQEWSRLYNRNEVFTFTSNRKTRVPGLPGVDLRPPGPIYRCRGSSWLVGTRSHRSGPIRTLLWAKSTPERGSFLSKDDSEFWLWTALSINFGDSESKRFAVFWYWVEIMADEQGESLKWSGNLSDRIEIASETLKMHRK